MAGCGRAVGQRRRVHRGWALEMMAHDEVQHTIYLERGHPVAVLIRWGAGGGRYFLDSDLAYFFGHAGQRPPSGIACRAL